MIEFQMYKRTSSILPSAWSKQECIFS